MNKFVGIAGAGVALALCLSSTQAVAALSTVGGQCEFDKLDTPDIDPLTGEVFAKCYFVNSDSGNDDEAAVAALLDTYFTNFTVNAGDVTFYNPDWRTNEPSDVSNDFLFKILQNKDGTNIAYNPADDPDQNTGPCADPDSSIPGESLAGCWFKNNSGTPDTPTSTNLPFAMSVKSGDAFALFVYSPSTIGSLLDTGTRGEGYWSTEDVPNNAGVSHITFWDITAERPLDPEDIPAPGPLALLGLGLGGLALVRRRKA